MTDAGRHLRQTLETALHEYLLATRLDTDDAVKGDMPWRLTIDNHNGRCVSMELISYKGPARSV